jgi:hypothetical protein
MQIKKPVLLLALLAGLNASTGSLFAATAKEPPSGCNASPWDSAQSEWDVGQKLPTFVEKEKLIKELKGGEKLFIPPKEFEQNQKYKYGEAYVGLGVKPWPYKRGMYIAVLETEMRKPSGSGGFEANYHSLYAAMLKQVGDDFSVVAKTAEPIGLPAYYIFNRFDFANYKISETETAFGLQVCHIRSYAGAGAPTASTAVLELMRNNDGKVERILSTPVFLENEPAKHFDAATISISNHSTNNFRDLLKTFRGKTATFQWQDGSYRTRDVDAFATFLRKSELSD